MLKFLARKRMCSLFRGQEEKHRDIHEDLFGQLVQQLQIADSRAMRSIP